ncbi:MAG: DUF2721 domain-containing protein [Sphingomonadales bacterium]|nr:DUF2721 domain-containing protein [Sphingomonadales bacterium]
MEQLTQTIQIALAPVFLLVAMGSLLNVDIINWSIALCVACGIVVCLMVAMLILMGSGQQALWTPVAASFIVAMLLLLAALVLFMLEVRLAIRTIHVPSALLER